MAVEVETGPVARLGAKGQGISVYFRDPDGSLVEFISYEERDTEAMMQKLLRPFELALLAVIGAVEWVIGWVERQSTPMKLGLGMLLGVAATMTVAAIYAGLR